ncbi:hypothetical protein O9929_12325 [Vibrio lentus]|nr:hypothetical protein [Vibrio lentus]
MGYNWDDIINAIVEKLAKAMPNAIFDIGFSGAFNASWISGTTPC